ncbi:hypothetical protein [Thiocystis violacea]|uniref:hypothetical protein n=1 Tax=Thiocystis violacea TaxID=13725 RepID=UPI0019083D4C|nr:hypothetical protein [Thiocystis violacea]
MSESFYFFRFDHADGRAKEWAYRVTETGEIEVRWGPAGRLVQRKIYPAASYGQVRQTAQTKARKGYLALGQRQIDRHGSVTMARSTPTTPATEPAAVTPPFRPHLGVSALDLSQIETDIDNGWF